MNLIPLGNRIIIAKPEVPEPVTSSGILLSAAEAPEPDNEAAVIAVGDTVTEVKVGDTVVFPSYGFTEITEEGKDYYIVDVADLLAKRNPVDMAEFKNSRK